MGAGMLIRRGYLIYVNWCGKTFLMCVGPMGRGIPEHKIEKFLLFFVGAMWPAVSRACCPDSLLHWDVPLNCKPGGTLPRGSHTLPHFQEPPGTGAYWQIQKQRWVSGKVGSQEKPALAGLDTADVARRRNGVSSQAQWGSAFAPPPSSRIHNWNNTQITNTLWILTSPIKNEVALHRLFTYPSHHFSL